MFWWPYGRGWGFWGWGRGNPYPFCRFYPWLPRGWRRCGYLPLYPLASAHLGLPSRLAVKERK